MSNNKKAFTIIEVVLVLAVAGLIFLMVFIAFPALQRSQRNSRRRSDMARILSNFTEYQSNNGRMPMNSAEMSRFVKRYVLAMEVADGGENPTANRWHNGQTRCMSDQFCDPDGAPYKFSSIGSPTESDVETVVSGFEAHGIRYYYRAMCGKTEGTITYSSGLNDIAIFYELEGGSIYCGSSKDS